MFILIFSLIVVTYGAKWQLTVAMETALVFRRAQFGNACPYLFEIRTHTSLRGGHMDLPVTGKKRTGKKRTGKKRICI